MSNRRTVDNIYHRLNDSVAVATSYIFPAVPFYLASV